ncbi:AraC-like DNA-binding protein [Ruminiclostridium sufflavum DSM 19573]|uniref:AraC-like DNA-binding protein n=1 Tax=Ruminiclostridium sufflavum DSM 19573 TaxID=1121337 RepID=A0A318XM82_9FIRM|nr:AraC family transcriptional regulator [Ruminiclostridium sufflavum]PYG87593.1 AraC-like DNA-binding protein [Ruminiclostridium sufflavum DSM 19573]
MRSAQKLPTEWRSAEDFCRGKALEAFAITLDYICTNKKEPSVRLSPFDRKALENVRKQLSECLLNPPQIKELTRITGLNKQKLMSGFKLLNGITIYEYVKRVRMQKALELLMESDMPVLEIAKSVGYCGDGHFHKTFRDVYGTTPGKLRKASQENMK